MKLLERLVRVRAIQLSMAIAGCNALLVSAAYPERPVTIVVAGAPAGGTDAIARVIASDLAETLGQSFVVENRAGAGGLIGTKSVLAAAPDGQTLLMGHLSTNAIMPALVKPRPYDPVRDFIPVGMVCSAPSVLVVSGRSQIKSVDALLEHGRKSVNGLSYGSPGIGLAQHLAGFTLGKAAKVPMLHVPYRGSAPALVDLVGGRIDMMFVTPGAAVPYLKSGELRALAVTSPERSRFLPDTPTIGELGFTTVTQTSWVGLFAPAGTPPEAVQALSRGLGQAMKRPATHALLESLYMEPARDPSTESFTSFVAAEAKKWADIVISTGLTAE